MKKEIILLADLLFAYINKNDSAPHDFEVSAVTTACDYLDKNYTGTKYSESLFKAVKKEMQDIQT